MTLDREDHRAILLELIDKAHFPGHAARKVVELRDAIEAAECVPSSDMPEDSEPA